MILDVILAHVILARRVSRLGGRSVRSCIPPKSQTVSLPCAQCRILDLCSKDEAEPGGHVKEREMEDLIAALTGQVQG